MLHPTVNLFSMTSDIIPSVNNVWPEIICPPFNYGDLFYFYTRMYYIVRCADRTCVHYACVRACALQSADSMFYMFKTRNESITRQYTHSVLYGQSTTSFL